MVDFVELQDIKEKVKALANGKNPFADDNLTFDNPQIIRLLFSVYEILDDITIKKCKKNPFVFTKELEEKLQIADKPRTLSRFVKHIKEVNDGISPTSSEIRALLIKKGMIEISLEGGGNRSIPTALGETYDITLVPYMSKYGYQRKIVCYGKKGQEYLVNLLKENYGNDEN